jgi:hypothetical protein
MLRLYVPVAVTVVLIATFTFWESIYSDRFTGSSVNAAEFGKRFENLPKVIGPWEGTDNPVDDKTLEVAGAVNHVSRTYKNTETGQVVDVWLIVGHARDIGRHTPDICYIQQGFAQDGSKQKHRIDLPNEKEPATFYTARFRREAAVGGATRVFWSWNPNKEGDDQWVAPDNQRLYFGNNTALYKLYFTTSMRDKDEPVADSVALEFAELMLPVVNRTLFPERYGTTAPAGEQPAAEGATDGSSEVSPETPQESPAPAAQPVG